jgi:hypothetical protein
MLLKIPDQYSLPKIAAKWTERFFLPFSRGASWLTVAIGVFLVTLSFAPPNVSSDTVRLKSTTLGVDRSSNISSPKNALELARKNDQISAGSELKLGHVWVYTVTESCKIGCKVEIPNIRSSKSTFWQLSNDSFKELEHVQSADGISINIPAGIDQRPIIGSVSKVTEIVSADYFLALCSH